MGEETCECYKDLHKCLDKNETTNSYFFKTSPFLL